MSRPRIAAQLLCVLAFFSDPILAAPIELGRAPRSTESQVRGEGLGYQTTPLVSSKRGGVTLDGAVLAEMASDKRCVQTACTADSPAALLRRLPFSARGVAGPVSEIDGELLDLFRRDAIRQSSVEPLFSRN